MTDTEHPVEIDHNTASETIEYLRDYAARRRADGAEHEAERLMMLADTIRHNADSNLVDCFECGWVGTRLGDVDDGPPVVCEKCGASFIADPERRNTLSAGPGGER